ncbi:MAG: EAL domain-containing protein [Pseudomonadota bacterium]|nr:EAL domain-containing protein [Pseudomonadota bacterium]
MTFRSAFQDLMGAQSCPGVERAQIEQLRQRIPVLYLSLSANIVALAATHYTANPGWQVVGLPGLLLAAISVRILWWIRVRPSTLTDGQIRRTLHNLSIVGAGFSFLILAWALSLRDSPSPSTGMTSAAHSIFFVGITFVSCISLLMHHRFAAITVGLSIAFPFIIYLLASGGLLEMAIALNVLLVSSAMLYVAIAFSRHFERSVAAAADMARLNAQNARMAASDALTALPNRRQFFSELEQAGHEKESFVVLVLDLDGFKPVNDVYGHHAGDEVLRQIAARFLALAPERGCVARLGGDEFGCLLIGVSVDHARQIAEQMIAACAEPVVTTLFTALVGASAGMCCSRTAHESIQVFERADYALFQAKRGGRGRVEVFNEAHENSMRRDSTVAQCLRRANLETELTTVFQPIVAASSHDIRAFEALVRWFSPEIGQVSPQEFIPIAERTDMIFKLSLRILSSALQQAETWPPTIGLKVNLSVRDLMSSKQTEALIAMVRLSSVKPGRVTFEITETIFAESMELIRTNVEIVRAAGCKIAIDDFGVGYSSLNYIHALAPDIIKIDRCFVMQSTSNDTTRRVIRTILELARNVGAKSVAEGVESLAEAEVLAELGCDELQGYYFAKPVSAEICTIMAATRRTDSPAVRLGVQAAISAPTPETPADPKAPGIPKAPEAHTTGPRSGSGSGDIAGTPPPSGALARRAVPA